MLDRLRSMEVFVTTVEAGAFASASTQLGMTAQMVSRHVQALEDRLRVRLLNRTTRRHSVTEVGRQYYEQCVVVLREAAVADTLALEALSEPQGQLRVSAPYQFGSQSLIEFAVDFMRRYPLVEIDLRLSDRLVNLVEDGIEVAFRIGDLSIGESSSLVVRPLRAGGRG